MSYILDALKKAERERKVGQVPSLDGTAVLSDPESERRRWPMLVAALLLLNAVVIVFVVFSVDTTQEETATVPLTATPEAAPLPEPARTIAPAAAVIEHTAADAAPKSEAVTGAMTQSAPSAAEEPFEPPTVAEAPDPAANGEQVFKIRKPQELPPLMADLPANARAGLPDLELTVHVFSDVPSKSFVFINDRRYQEGETMREGPRLESIEKQGVVLSYEGTQFLLPGRW